MKGLDTKKTFTDKTAFTLDKRVIAYNNLWEEYNPIEIKGTFGLGETKFKGAITQHTSTCGQDCSSTIEIYLPENGVLVDDITFKTLQSDGSWNEQDVRNYQFSYIKDGKTNLYSIGQEVQAGEYILTLNANKRPSRTVDWIIETQGKTINEWAIWGNISEGDGAEVILNLPADTSTTLYNEIEFNATTNIAVGAYITNMTLWTNKSGSWAASTSVDFTSSNYFIDVYASSSPNINQDTVVTTQIGSNVWRLNSTEIVYETQRAKVMKALFYGTDGTDDRVTGISGLTKLVSNDANDEHLNAFWYVVTHRNDGGRTYGTFLNDTANNVTTWVYFNTVSSGDSVNANFDSPDDTSLKSLSGTSTLALNNLGTNNLDNVLNPANFSLRAFAGAGESANARALILSKGNITMSGIAPATAEYFIDQGIPSIELYETSLTTTLNGLWLCTK